MHRKYALFDLDGTLLDSYDCVCRNIDNVLRHFGYAPCNPSIYKKFRTEELRELFRYVATEIMNDSVTIADFKSVFDQIHEDDCVEGVTVINSTKQLLDMAKMQGYSIIVLTNKRQEIAEKMCRYFFPTDTFAKIIGRDTEKAIKPQRALKRLSAFGIAAEDCLMLYGDSDTDRQTAMFLNATFSRIIHN